MATPKSLTNTGVKNPLEKVSIKNLRFLQEYVKTGNITQSWKKFNKTKNDLYAYQAASNFLKRYPDARKAFFDMYGVNDVAIAKTLKEGMEANRSIMYKGTRYDFEDHPTRIKSAEISNRILGNEQSGSNSVGNQLNVQIIAEGGTFKVVEN